MPCLILFIYSRRKSETFSYFLDWERISTVFLDVLRHPFFLSALLIRESINCSYPFLPFVRFLSFFLSFSHPSFLSLLRIFLSLIFSPLLSFLFLTFLTFFITTFDHVFFAIFIILTFLLFLSPHTFPLLLPCAPFSHFPSFLCFLLFFLPSFLPSFFSTIFFSPSFLVLIFLKLSSFLFPTFFLLYFIAFLNSLCAVPFHQNRSQDPLPFHCIILGIFHHL
ncbi:unnamed protein product [Acanthosepion pharaonis]|uniref:Uncharacterized protein n=1 Tax=Acanthosepion pharaonis TaxID=158019 RepID=A0A812DY66_ACAPH|nr:unnamed protein product [Sepia pharaonis]